MTIKKSTIIAAVLLLTVSVSAQSAPEGITSGQQLQKQAEAVTRDIGTQELKTMLDDELEMVLIDIRTTDEVKNMGGTYRRYPELGHSTRLAGVSRSKGCTA